MANYEIRVNHDFNSKEIYFTGKPSEEVRAALKALKFRWHGTKRCWYGFADDNKIVDTICAATPDGKTETGVISQDGYLGATEITGINHRYYQTSTELAKAIRDHFKKSGIKGVTVAKHDFSMGRSLSFTIKATEEDYISFEDFLRTYDVCRAGNWFTDGEKDIHRDTYFTLSAEDQEKIREATARRKYDAMRKKNACISEYSISEYKMFTNAFIDRIYKIKAIVDSYNHDDSNSMVDYFDRDFYTDYYVNPVIEAVTI